MVYTFHPAVIPLLFWNYQLFFFFVFAFSFCRIVPLPHWACLLPAALHNSYLAHCHTTTFYYMETRGIFIYGNLTLIGQSRHMTDNDPKWSKQPCLLENRRYMGFRFFFFFLGGEGLSKKNVHIKEGETGSLWEKGQAYCLSVSKFASSKLK